MFFEISFWVSINGVQLIPDRVSGWNHNWRESYSSVTVPSVSSTTLSSYLASVYLSRNVKWNVFHTDRVLPTFKTLALREICQWRLFSFCLLANKLNRIRTIPKPFIYLDTWKGRCEDAMKGVVLKINPYQNHCKRQFQIKHIWSDCTWG